MGRLFQKTASNFEVLGTMASRRIASALSSGFRGWGSQPLARESVRPIGPDESPASLSPDILRWTTSHSAIWSRFDWPMK
jgi:hypothetical protein